MARLKLTEMPVLLPSHLARQVPLSTVACRLYEKTNLSDVQIARITGHKDLRMLRRYASLRGSDLAAALW